MFAERNGLIPVIGCLIEDLPFAICRELTSIGLLTLLVVYYLVNAIANEVYYLLAKIS